MTDPLTAIREAMNQCSARQRAYQLETAQIADLHGIKIVEDPTLEPNEMRIIVGSDFYQMIKSG